MGRRCGRMGKRLTIGFIDEDSYYEHHDLMAKGVFACAFNHDINVIRIGHFLKHNTASNPYQEKMVMEYVRQFRLDGLIVLGWARVTYNPDFSKVFDGIPMVSVGIGKNDIPGVYFPGGKYVEEIFYHLANVHKKKKIAYIAPIRMDIRDGIYRKVMTEFDIYDPALFVDRNELSGLSLPDRGHRAVEILLDERKTSPDAIVSLYSEETYELIKDLNARGIRVPEDIAVTSFGDSEISRFSTPAFTTVYFPWKELGYYACEIMYRYITRGKVPFRTEVDGKVIYRSSCGCVAKSAGLPATGRIDAAGLKFEELDDDKLEEITGRIARETPFTAAETRDLINAFRESFIDSGYRQFLMELELKLRKILYYDEYSQFEQITAIFKKSLMPYFLPYAPGDLKKITWADNIFYQMQVLLQNILSNALAYEDAEKYRAKLILGDVGKILLTNFSLDSLMDSLETNLSRVGVKGCWLFLFKDPMENKPFSDYQLVFEYSGGRRIRHHLGGRNCAYGPESILFRENRPYFLLSHMLHVGDEFFGFIFFELDRDDIRIAHILSTNISIALNDIILFEKLDKSYRKLMDQAHKKGMADTTAILHNIANVMNSITVTVNSMKELLQHSGLNDIEKANGILEGKIDTLDDFIKNDPKGKLLLRFYAMCGDTAAQFRDKFRSDIARLLDRTNLIEGIINTQQTLTGVRSNLERVDLIPVIENVLMMNQTSIQEHGIKVVRKYGRSVRALAHRIKLFHILTNVVKNAVESMQARDDAENVLTIEVTDDSDYVYIRISDTGAGIEEDKLESIFSYGFTTKHGGHGFGLHSCANYMNEMKGKIWAENVPDGTGACFVMQFRSPAST